MNLHFNTHQNHTMLLRSSSTPLLGSLLPPDPVGKPSPSSFAFHCNPVSSPAATASLVHSAAFRRTNSEGNLNTLSHAPHSVEDSSFDSFNSKPNHFRRSLLQSIPSFSLYGSKGAVKEEDDDEEDEDEDEDEECFRIQSDMEAAIVSSEVRAMEQAWSRVASGNEMYLAKGLGIGIAGAGGSGGGGGGSGPRSSGSGGGGGGGGEQQGMEDYYKRMIVENPGNALVLTNYAEFLYQWKGDVVGAEEYYSRAILVDSKDGQILSKYAKLVWELHHDQLKASSYFQLAIQASPHDSHVQAAYANFLWETEDEDEDDEHDRVKEMVRPQTCRAAATA